MAVATLRPAGAWNNFGTPITVNNVGWTFPDSINDDPDSPDTSSYFALSFPNSGEAGYAYIPLTDVPADFLCYDTVADSFVIKVYAGTTGWVNDTLNFAADLVWRTGGVDYELSGSTDNFMSNNNYANQLFTLNKSSGGTETFKQRNRFLSPADWNNDVYLRFGGARTSNMGADSCICTIYAVEVEVTYNTTSEFPRPAFRHNGGAVEGPTSSDLSVPIPAHEANDILIVHAWAYISTTAVDVDPMPTPAGWTLLTSKFIWDSAAETGQKDGWTGIFWMRATGSGTTLTLTRGANWATTGGMGASQIVVRHAQANGDPFEGVAFGPTWYGTTPGYFPALDVQGTNRLGFLSMEGTPQGSVNNPTGWTFVLNGGSTYWRYRLDSANADADIASGNVAVSVSTASFVTFALKPMSASLPKSLIIPSNQAVRRAANW